MTRRSGWCWPRVGLARVSVPDRKAADGPESSRPVSDWELASRLSYFLWSSMPDDELRKEAAAGRLHRPGRADGPGAPHGEGRPRPPAGDRVRLPVAAHL